MRYNPCQTPATAPRALSGSPIAVPMVAPTQLVVIGTRIHCTLYGGRDGIVYGIHGQQTPGTIRQLGGGVAVTGGSAHFDIVFTGEHARLHPGVPEAIVCGGVQWSIEEGIATPEEIRTALAAAEAKRQADEAVETAKSADRAARRRALPKEFPWLTVMEASGKSSHALGGLNLKTELTRAFPGIRFSVKSESYSGGSSLRVSWQFGPTTAQVQPFADKYKEGSFDGMTDSYHHNHENVWPSVFGGACHVFTSRTWPDDFYGEVGRALCQLQKVEYLGEHSRLFGPDDQRDLLQHVRALMEHTPFPAGAKFKAVHAREFDGTAAHWCRIELDTPEVKAAPPVATGGVTLSINEARGMVELRFAAKPDEAVRAQLKAARFRWFGPAGCWYHKNTPANLAWAMAFAGRGDEPVVSLPAPTIIAATIMLDNPVSIPVQTVQTVHAPVAVPPAPAVPAWRRRLIR